MNGHSLIRLQNYKSVAKYNSALYKITSRLQLRGDNITDFDMLEKMFTTFYKNNLILMQQYWERKFKKYCDLLSCMFVAKQNCELLLKNHSCCPTDFATTPEAHATSSQKGGKNQHGKNKYSGGNKSFAENKNHDRSSKPQSKYKGKDKGKVKFNNS